MICGISIVRNEVDIIEFCLWHHLNQGLDGIIICDNGSTDGTLELLNKISTGDKRVTVISNDGPFHQEQIMNELYDMALGMGFSWAVFFDADEIWKSDNGLAVDINNINSDYIEVEIENFVQNKSYNLNNVYKNIIWKVVEYTTEEKDIINGVRSTVEYRWPSKFILKVSPYTHVGPGAHYFKYKDLNKIIFNTNEVSENFKCYQVPVRSYDHLIRKAEHGVRLIQQEYSKKHGWECQRLGNLLLSDQAELKNEWECNSTKDGKLRRPDQHTTHLFEDRYILNRYKEFLRNRRGNL
jgi:glycosyltransferase involved in cell wall biosynthesis